MYKNHNFNKECNAKRDECYVVINEKVHRGFAELNLDDRTAHLYFDDKHIASKKMWRVELFGFEQDVEIEGEKLHCVFDGYDYDIAIHGKYIKHLQLYVPVKILQLYVYEAILLLIFVIVIVCIVRPTAKIDVAIFFIVVVGLAAIISNPVEKHQKRSLEESKLYEDTGYENATKR